MKVTDMEDSAVYFYSVKEIIQRSADQGGLKKAASIFDRGAFLLLLEYRGKILACGKPAAVGHFSNAEIRAFQ